MYSQGRAAVGSPLSSVDKVHAQERLVAHIEQCLVYVNKLLPLVDAFVAAEDNYMGTDFQSSA